MADLLALLLEHGGKRLQVLARVHRAHRVVRRVDDDGRGLLVDGGAMASTSSWKLGTCVGTSTMEQPMVSIHTLYSGKYGAGDDDLVASVGDGAQADGDGAAAPTVIYTRARLRRDAIGGERCCRRWI